MTHLKHTQGVPFCDNTSGILSRLICFRRKLCTLSNCIIYVYIVYLDIEKIENSDGETKVGNTEHLVQIQIVPLASVYFCIYILPLYYVL